MADCWKSLLIKGTVFLQLETSIRRANAVINCLLIVAIRRDQVIRIWKLLKTLISYHTIFGGLFGPFSPISLWSLRLKLPRRARMLIWWPKRFSSELLQNIGNPARLSTGYNRQHFRLFFVRVLKQTFYVTKYASGQLSMVLLLVELDFRTCCDFEISVGLGH